MVDNVAGSGEESDALRALVAGSLPKYPTGLPCNRRCRRNPPVLVGAFWAALRCAFLVPAVRIMFSKSHMSRRAIQVGLGLVVLLQISIGRAESISGNLAADAGAINVHTVTCPAGTYLLSTQAINNTQSAPLLNTQSAKGKKATNTTDPTSGDSNFGPLVLNAGSDGVYYVTVNKSGSGPVDYVVQYSCMTLNDVVQSGLLSITPPQIGGEAREGVTTNHVLEIGQGCQTADTNPNGSFKYNPVIAESVVFPIGVENGERSDTGASIALKDVVSTPAAPDQSISSIQDKSIFKIQDLKLDGSGNVVGFHAWRGKLKTNFSGAVPFAYVAPSFNPDSCAKRLLLKVAVADICKSGKNLDIGSVNLWIPDVTPKFSKDALIPGSDGTDHSGFPATLVINRTSALNPACNEGYDVTVWPGDDAIDAYLPIRKYWQP
jgi:hypothetical protein